MAELFGSGRIVDLILALVLLEAVVLQGYRTVTGRGPNPSELLGNLLAGACLLLALRVALTGGDWRWLALCLGAAGLAHLADLRLRLTDTRGRADVG